MSRSLATTLYPSLLTLPGVTIDQYGNLNLENEGSGLRTRYDYLMAIDPDQLKGKVLAELLDWIRWGSETAIMWECTLKELVDLIKKWESANPDANREDYSDKINWERIVSNWDNFFKEKGVKKYLWLKRKCPKCSILMEPYNDCRSCGRPWWDLVDAYGNQRGEGQYYLILMFADGHTLAARAWLSRNTDRRKIEEGILIREVGL